MISSTPISMLKRRFRVVDSVAPRQHSGRGRIRSGRACGRGCRTLVFRARRVPSHRARGGRTYPVWFRHRTRTSTGPLARPSLFPSGYSPREGARRGREPTDTVSGLQTRHEELSETRRRRDGLRECGTSRVHPRSDTAHLIDSRTVLRCRLGTSPSPTWSASGSRFRTSYRILPGAILPSWLQRGGLHVERRRLAACVWRCCRVS